MKKAISLVLLLALILSFTACAYREPNAKFTITAMCFEKNGSSVTAYLQAMDFSKGENKTFVSVGQGRDVSLALKDIKTALSKDDMARLFGKSTAVIAVADKGFAEGFAKIVQAE